MGAVAAARRMRRARQLLVLGELLGRLDPASCQDTIDAVYGELEADLNAFAGGWLYAAALELADHDKSPNSWGRVGLAHEWARNLEDPADRASALARLASTAGGERAAARGPRGCRADQGRPGAIRRAGPRRVSPSGALTLRGRPRRGSSSVVRTQHVRFCVRGNPGIAHSARFACLPCRGRSEATQPRWRRSSSPRTVGQRLSTRPPARTLRWAPMFCSRWCGFFPRLNWRGSLRLAINPTSEANVPCCSGRREHGMKRSPSSRPPSGAIHTLARAEIWSHLSPSWPSLLRVERWTRC